MDRHVTKKRVVRNVTRRRIVELRQLAELSDQNIYRRVQLASQVLADTAWIADEHHGDEIEARQHINDTCFASLGGYVQLDTLLAIFSMFPLEEQWKDYKYDLRAMELLWEEQRKEESTKPHRSAKPRATHAAIEAAEQEAVKQAAVAAKERKEKEDALSEADRLTLENESLRTENVQLKALIIALKAQVRELTRKGS